MKIPASTSRNYRIAQVLYMHGPLTFAQLVEKVPSLTESSLRIVLDQFSMIHRDGILYDIPPYLKKHFADLEEASQPKVLGEIVATRTVSKRNELKGYTASMTRNLREPIRLDVGFKSASPSASVFWSE